MTLCTLLRAHESVQATCIFQLLERKNWVVFSFEQGARVSGGFRPVPSGLGRMKRVKQVTGPLTSTKIKLKQAPLFANLHVLAIYIGIWVTTK